jgi:hypothetical protein
MPSLSSTIKPLSCDIGDCDNYCGFGSAQCTFSNSYQTCVLKHPNQVCTISGPVYEDDFALGSLHAKSAFGVITYQTPGFQQLETVDGIIGLAGSTSFGRPEPIPALHQAGMIANSFAFCFANRTHGRFMVGGAAAGTYRPGSTQWVPLSGEYSITMTSILVGGVAVQFSSADAILDSGTNVLLLDSDTFSAVQGQFTQCSNCAHVNSFFNGGCHNLTASELAAYPPLQLQFGTVTLSMPPRSYLVEHPAHNNARCLGIISTGPRRLSHHRRHDDVGVHDHFRSHQPARRLRAGGHEGLRQVKQTMTSFAATPVLFCVFAFVSAQQTMPGRTVSAQQWYVCVWFARVS